MADTRTFTEADITYKWSTSTAPTSALAGTNTRSMEWFTYEDMSHESVSARKTNLIAMSKQEPQASEFTFENIESKIGPWSASLNDRVAGSQVLRFEDDWSGNGVTGMMQQRQQNRRRFGVTMRGYSLNIPEYLAPFSKHNDLKDALSHVVKKIEVVDRMSLLDALNCLELPGNTTFTGNEDARTTNLAGVVHPNISASTVDGGYVIGAYTANTTVPKNLSIFHIQVAIDTLMSQGSIGSTDEMLLLIDQPSWGRLRTTSAAGDRDYVNTMVPIGNRTSLEQTNALAVAGGHVTVVPFDYSPGGVTTGYVRRTISSTNYDVRSAWLIRKSGFISSYFSQFPKNQVRVFLQKEYGRTILTHLNFSGWKIMGQNVVRIDFLSPTLGG